MIRVLDIFFSATGLFFGFPLLILLFIVGLFDTGSPLFYQKRVGRHQRIFTLVKFRTMRIDIDSLPTHLVGESAVTYSGHFLRKSKMDELPQLWNVLIGDMSLVGPRPCLDSQLELICEREVRQVFSVRPGITGLAQIKGIDMSMPVKLATIDEKMIQSASLKNYFIYIMQTLLGEGSGDKVSRDK